MPPERDRPAFYLHRAAVSSGVGRSDVDFDQFNLRGTAEDICNDSYNQAVPRQKISARAKLERDTKLEGQARPFGPAPAH